MTEKDFSNWLDDLKNIWEKRTPDSIIDICAPKFVWYETSFSKPLTSKRVLLSDWRGILKQKNIKFSYKIIATNENVAIANWKAKLTRIPSGEKVEMDGIFQITLDKYGKCKEFRQWRSYK